MVRVLLLVGFLLACSLSRAEPLRIGVSETILSLPLYVAESEGFFKKRGVDVEIQTCVGGNRCVKAMLAGQTDLSTATELPVVFNSFIRQDFSILTSFVSTSGDLKVLTRTAKNISSPLDLKGKTVGFVSGASSQYVLDLVLVYNGIDPAEVNLKPITPETALIALANAEIDALCIWEPFVSRILAELKADVSLLPVPKLYTETFNLIAMNSIIKKSPAELERVLMALKDSTQFIQKNPEQAKALAAKRLNISAELMNKIFDDYRYRLSLTRALPRTMEGQARWALREGHVNSSQPQPDYANFLRPEILKAVDPSAVSLH